MQNSRAKGTDAEKKAKRVANAARMKAKRAADKAAKLAKNTSPQTQPQNIQVRLPRSSDETLSEDSEPERNLAPLIRKRKPINFTMANLEADKSDDESDGFVANVSPVKTRRLPKRKCTAKKVVSDSDDEEFEDFLNNLVETAIADNDLLHHQALSLVPEILDDVISTIFKPKSGIYKRKFSLGRKSKTAKKFSKYRKIHESEVQYEARLKKSSLFKSKMKKLDDGMHHVRKLEILKDKR